MHILYHILDRVPAAGTTIDIDHSTPRTTRVICPSFSLHARILNQQYPASLN
jgi:hypothetical protein